MRRCRGMGFTLVELLVVLAVLVLLAAMLLPALTLAREKVRRVNCVNRLKSMGLALLMYTGDNRGHFPVYCIPYAANFEPLNSQDIMDDGKVYACPSARDQRTLARDPNYLFLGSGLTDNNDSAAAITIACDESGNHPDNGWMNALFIDAHAEGARPDGTRPGRWNLTRARSE